MECWVNDAPLDTLHIPLFKYQQSPETARNFKIFTVPNIWTWRKTSKMIESSVVAVFFPLKNLSFFSFSNFSLLSIFSHLNNSWSYEKFKRNTEELFFVRLDKEKARKKGIYFLYQSSIIWMVVTYCYLERNNYKVLKFSMSNTYFKLSTFLFLSAALQ